MNNLVHKSRSIFLFLKSKKEAASLQISTNTEGYSLKDDSVLKLLFAFVGPAVLGLLINALYNLVDRIFVGQFVGANGLSAVTMVFPVTLFQFGFILLFGSGSGILIAKYLGEERTGKAEDALGNAIAGLLITIVIFTTMGLFFYKPLLVAFGAQGTLLNLSVEYLVIIIMGFPLSFFLALEFTCRAEGNPRFPAKLILLSSIINVCLDYVFMKIFNMGISGAALATIIAQSVNAILLIRYYLSGKSLVKIVWKKIKLKKHIILPILSVGFAPFIMDIAISLQNVFANSLLLQSGGTDGVAAMGIIFGINVFFMMTALGTGDGIQPVISYNFGAKRYDRAVKTLKYALKMVFLIALSGVAILELFPTSMIRVFIDDNENITTITKIAIQIFAISIPFYMVQIVMTRYFQALQKNKIATFLALLRPVLFAPIALILTKIYGLIGIWIAFVISDGLAALISFLLVKKYSIKKLITRNTINSNKQLHI
ncbi:MATE family efflux transporter [Flavivirga jejuensis]|uniref:Multidrug export protein MepA n=1 Tax=Flavivirga jejuensis TaxID=870487 RepID=A0ABT8WKX6_9FLAO|nr:MATE family efflux transporter [Flavivirga jejuensis]MDO5973800.1 MATE family efflux transporter [Flavivirga jejuensis]